MSSVFQERALFSRNELCFPGTGSVFQERALFSRNELCFPGTSSVFQERALFSRNELCFPGTSSVFQERERTDRDPDVVEFGMIPTVGAVYDRAFVRTALPCVLDVKTRGHRPRLQFESSDSHADIRISDGVFLSMTV